MRWNQKKIDSAQKAETLASYTSFIEVGLARPGKKAFAKKKMETVIFLFRW